MKLRVIWAWSEKPVSAATAAMLGHPNDTLLFEHYRALTTKKEAERFYGLLPAKTARRKVINLKTVGL